MREGRTFNVFTSDFQLRPDRLLYHGLTQGENIGETWDPESGMWQEEETGVVGEIREEKAAVLWSRKSFPGDIAVAYRGRAVGGRGLDINCYLNGNGRIYSGSNAQCYIAVVGGWWSGKCGLEKFPEDTLTATTSFFGVERNTWVDVMTGRYENWIFLFVDGEKILELRDPEPIDSVRYPRIAVSTWNSRVEFSDLRVYRL